MMILAAGIQADKKQATNMNEKQHIATYISTCKRQQYRSNSQGQAFDQKLWWTHGVQTSLMLLVVWRSVGEGAGLRRSKAGEAIGRGETETYEFRNSRTKNTRELREIIQMIACKVPALFEWVVIHIYVPQEG